MKTQWPANPHGIRSSDQVRFVCRVPCVGVGVALVDDHWAAVDGRYRAVACIAIELVAVRGLFGRQGVGIKRC